MALLGLTILAYGLRALSLGFFWDDWPYLWFYHTLGPQGIVNAFSGDRPFLSFIYTLSLGVLGNSAPAWQIFDLFAHWATSLGLWLALALTWPRSAHKAAWAAMLFAVYPGFTQHWIAVIYGQAFVLFAAMFFSIALTLWLARSPAAGTLRRWQAPVTLLALLLSAFTMFSTEYFFGLELLRPLLLWWIFSSLNAPPHLGRRLLRLLRWWAPYLALMMVFVIWRGFIHTFPGKSLVVVQGITSAPFQTLSNLVVTVFGDWIELTLVAWGQPLQLGGLLENSVSSGLRLIALILFAGLLLAVYLARLRPTLRSLPRVAAFPWGREAIFTGMFALLVAGWPFWVTGLPMRMSFPQDRYSLPLAVGVSLLLAGLIDVFGRNLTRKALLLSVLLALAVGFQFQTSLAYREDWDRAKDFFWQLTWRAPGIQPHTLFLADSLPFRYFEDDSLTAPLNWTYDPNNRESKMNYLFYDLLVRHASLPSLQPNLPVERDVRGAVFQGSTSQSLVVYYGQSGCLQVLDPVYDADLYRLPDRLQRALPLSAPQQQIVPDAPAAVPPAEIFGSEPAHRWCYYYEKVELARQVGNWEEIVRLTDQSIGQGLKPDDPAEYLPFIEGHVQFGLWEDAYQLSQRVDRMSPALRPALCSIWRRSVRADQPISDGQRTVLGWVNQSYDCAIP